MNLNFLIHQKLKKNKRKKIADKIRKKRKKKNPFLFQLIKKDIAPLNTEKKELSLPVVQKAENLNQKVLTTQDFIRPGPELKSSLEGFFLNQRSDHTRKSYLKDLKRFVKFLHLRKQTFGIEVLNRIILIAYKEFLIADELEHTTIDRHLAMLRSLFDWLVSDDLIEKSPAQAVRFLRPKRISKTKGLSDEEVRKILSLPNRHTVSGALHHAILMVLFYCGMRRSELCALKTSHIGKERGHFVLKVRGKGNSERLIVLKPEVIHSILYYLKISNKDASVNQWLFTPVKNNRTKTFNKPLDPSSIYYIVSQYAKKSGIVFNVSPHSCRATAISNARDRKVSDRAIQEYAGWSTPQMITQYDKRKTNIEESAAHEIDYNKKSAQ